MNRKIFLLKLIEKFNYCQYVVFLEGAECLRYLCRGNHLQREKEKPSEAFYVDETNKGQGLLS